jgi:hypothetical protein
MDKMKYLLITILSIAFISCGTDSMEIDPFYYEGNAQYQGDKNNSKVFVINSVLESGSNKIAISNYNIPFDLEINKFYKVNIKCNTYSNSCELISIQ